MLEDYVIDFFGDLDYLLQRVTDLRPVNILAAVRDIWALWKMRTERGE